MNAILWTALLLSGESGASRWNQSRVESPVVVRVVPAIEPILVHPAALTLQTSGLPTQPVPLAPLAPIPAAPPPASAVPAAPPAASALARPEWGQARAAFLDGLLEQGHDEAAIEEAGQIFQNGWLAGKLAAQGLSLPKLFARYDAEYGVHMVTDAEMKAYARAVDFPGAPAATINGRFILMKESTMAKLRAGGLFEKMALRHEKLHIEYKAANPPVPKDPAGRGQRRMAEELFTHFASFVEVYGRSRLREKFGGAPSYPIWVFDSLSGSYLEFVTDETVKADLVARLRAAIMIVDRGLFLGNTQFMLAYMKTCSTLDQILAMVQPELLERISKAAVKVRGHEAQRRRFLEFRRAYEEGRYSAQIVSERLIVLGSPAARRRSSTMRDATSPLPRSAPSGKPT